MGRFPRSKRGALELQQRTSKRATFSTDDVRRGSVWPRLAQARLRTRTRRPVKTTDSRAASLKLRCR